MAVLLNIFLYVFMLAPVLLSFHRCKSQLENQISEIRAALSDLQSQIKKADDTQNNGLVHQTDKVGGNHYHETKSTPPDVKDEDEKADIKSTGYNTNRIQCHNPDKEETNDDQISETTVTWWFWMKNLGIQSYRLLTVFNHLFIGCFFLHDLFEKIQKMLVHENKTQHYCGKRKQKKL